MSFDFLQFDLAQQKVKSRYRQLTCNEISGEHKVIVVNEKSYINFSSNDYLGLNNHPKIIKAFQEGIDKFGLCASSSSLVTGYHYAHQALEHQVCEWLNKSHCLLFSSGFTANLALFEALGKSANTGFYLDKLSHASMIDGAYKTQAKVKRFKHNDVEHLTTILNTNNAPPHKLIASEGIFSMDGCQAKVSELATIAKKNDAWLYLDDAHSIGVIGDEGQGSNSIENIDITMATMGKAFATGGALLACDKQLHEYLVNFSRHYIYSTAISPAMAWASKTSIELIKTEQWRRDKIFELSELFKRSLDNHIEVITTHSSIHAIVIGDEYKTIVVSEVLKSQGFWVTPIRPPTVAVNSSRLRVTICADHSAIDINNLSKSINKALA
jgi:8-amino-7-oxononanoate synthase